MKRVILALSLGACVVSVWGKVFQMDSRGDAVVEVNKVGGEYKIVCTFSPQTKFDNAINAKFNDAKGDSLCKKGIARYLGVGTNDQFSISGLYSVAPVKNNGGKLRYAFAVPVSGCKVEVGAAERKVVSKSQNKSAPVVACVAPPTKVLPVKTNVVPRTEKAVKPVPMTSGEAAKAPAAKVVRSASYMSVVQYKEVNGRRSMVSRREYRGCDFKSREEFDQLCANEFARVRALGEKNLRAVRDLGKK